MIKPSQSRDYASRYYFYNREKMSNDSREERIELKKSPLDAEFVVTSFAFPRLENDLEVTLKSFNIDLIILPRNA